VHGDTGLNREERYARMSSRGDGHFVGRYPYDSDGDLCAGGNLSKSAD
jgi:hypothetical protein